MTLEGLRKNGGGSGEPEGIGVCVHNGGPLVLRITTS
jgi:hypothetical protein